MAKTKARKSSLVQKNALRVLEIASLNVDPSYQRGVNRDAPKKIADNFDPVAFGIPLVGEREDGSLWIVDGQQRIESLKLRNEAFGSQKQKKWVRCEVFASSGPEHEAQVFKRVNKDRTKLRPLQLFTAMLTAGDESCWAIKKMAEDRGFKIPKGESHGDKSREADANMLRCVNMMGRIYAKSGDDGEAALSFVLDVIKSVWDGDKLRTKGEILGGLWQFWKRKGGVVDTERLIPRLASSAPAKILHSASLGVSDATGNVADVIEKLYRKRLIRNR